MTDIELNKTNSGDFTPEVAKLNKKNKISLIPIIAIGIGLILLLFAFVYMSYFRNNDKKNTKNLDKSESEIIKKEFSFKKANEEEAKEPTKEITERSFNFKNRDKPQVPQTTFKKYKSIPLKSDEASEHTDATNKEAQKSDEEVAVVAEKIKIDPNFLILEGTYIPCSLTTKFVSDVAGRITCTIAADVYSSNGCVKLIEKGTKAIGMYQSGTLQHGVGRMFVIWTKLITPDFKRIKLVDTQVVGQLGEAGINGWIDSHFFKRFGGALMLSTVRDIVKNTTERKRQENNNTVVNVNSMDNTKDTFVSIVEKMLEKLIANNQSS